MKYRIYEIEGSFYNSVSDKLFECVVNKEVIYEPSLFIKKGVIKKAVLDGTTLKLYVSTGLFFPCLIFIIFVFLIVCTIFTFI